MVGDFAYDRGCMGTEWVVDCKLASPAPTAADLPLWVIHVAWPIAGATWIVFQGEHAWNDLRVLAGRPR
jgi:hypothetical protein